MPRLQWNGEDGVWVRHPASRRDPDLSPASLNLDLSSRALTDKRCWDRLTTDPNARRTRDNSVAPVERVARSQERLSDVRSLNTPSAQTLASSFPPFFPLNLPARLDVDHVDLELVRPSPRSRTNRKPGQALTSPRATVIGGQGPCSPSCPSPTSQTPSTRIDNPTPDLSNLNPPRHSPGHLL